MRIAICDGENIFSQKLLKYMDDKYHSLDLLINTFDSGENLVSYYWKGNPHFEYVKSLNNCWEELGPDGGTSGGEVIFGGTPQEMVSHCDSITAKYLRKSLQQTE